VLVECYSEDGRVRVRPKSPGFKAGWHVQFPRDIRTPAPPTWSTSLRESGSGGFYRVVGQIRTATGVAVPTAAAKTAAKASSKKVARAAAPAAKTATKKVSKKVSKR
jgi:hypothetical protein